MEIVIHANLIVETGVDLSKTNTSFFSRFGEDVSKIFSKIRGILDRKEEIIYLDLSLPGTRQAFIKLHEVGHHLLPWQKAVLECLDDDATLDLNTHQQFEEEANYFATITLFQLDRFNDKMKKLQLSIGAAMHLAKTFGSSNHASMRRYVECSGRKCALLVLEKHPLAGNLPWYQARDYFQSEKFSNIYGNIEWPDKLGYYYEFVKDYHFSRRLKTDGRINLPTKQGIINFHYHFFNSTYNGFILIFPNSEVQKSKTQIIILNDRQ